jgi:alkylation response protein AidB-like acyl-CoA dehydrogenase
MSDGEPMTATDTPMTPAPAEPDERAAFRAEVRAFLEAHAPRREPASTWAVNFHTDEASKARAFERGVRWQRLLAEHGLAGLSYPAGYGGRGGPPWREAIYAQEAAAYAATSGFISSTMAMLGPTLMKWGTEEQKRTLLPRMLRAEDTYCQLFSEPGAGSDLAGLATRADRDGDELVVNGQKVWNSSAQLCNRGMLLVRTDADEPKHRGITFLLVDMATPGIECRPLVQANGAREFNEVFLTDVRVPVSAVLGEIGGGWSVARTVLSNEAAFIGGGMSIVPANVRLRALAEHFDRTDDPVVRQRLAVSYSRDQIVKWLGARLAESFRRPDGHLDPSMLKLFATASRAHNGELAMAIGGVRVAVSEGDDEIAHWAQMELLTRYALSIGGGTTEVQKNNLGERALGLPREPRDDHLVPWKDVPRG